MILLIGVAAGLLGGFLRATLNKRAYQPYSLRLVWLVILAMVGQWFVFTFPLTRASLPDVAVLSIFVLSQFMLLVFVMWNRKTPGFLALGIGLILNLSVIVLNGGLMPVSPETASWLFSDGQEFSWKVGERLGFSKDIVLPKGETVLWFLSDRFRTPSFLFYKAAFSLGDIFIAGGAFWLFWSIGGQARETSLQENTYVSNDLPTHS